MANVGQLIQRMSEYLDKGRPDVKVITVRAKRRTVLKFIKPKWPGGPLLYDGREILTMDAVTRPHPPAMRPKKRRAPDSSGDQP